jgi:hypothetical protein
VDVARGHRRRGRGGVGAATVLGPNPRGARMCERDGVRRGVHARQVTTAGGQGWGSRRDAAVVHGGARLGAMGGGEHGVRGRLTSVCACVVRSVVRCVRGGQGIGAPPLGDRVRGLPGHGKAGATRAP